MAQQRGTSIQYCCQSCFVLQNVDFWIIGALRQHPEGWPEALRTGGLCPDLAVALGLREGICSLDQAGSVGQAVSRCRTRV